MLLARRSTLASCTPTHRVGVAPFRAHRRNALPVSCVARPQRSQHETQTSPETQDLPALIGSLSVAALAPFLLDVSSASATGGEYGILEGRTFALIHPALMIFFFSSTLYAGWLGWQWRRAREVGEEIRQLKKQLPTPAEGETAAPSPLSGQVSSLEKERKELIAGNYRDKHWQWSSLILGGGTGIAIAGCANTFMRTGKLFPGPHLFAGAAIVALWALAAALVPAMQKGNNNARNAHIALNAANVLLFAWQLPTGFEIVGKVFEFTQWP